MDAALVGDVIISNISSEAFLETVSEVGRIGNWMQALGIVVILWLIFQVFNVVALWHKLRLLASMQENLNRLELKMEKKLDEINKKISKK